MDVPPEIAARVRDLVRTPPVVEDLAGRFARAGKQLFLVGGSVRDALLERSGKQDLDFATDAEPDEILEIVRGWHEGTWLQGVEFGTVGVQKSDARLEITRFRAERYDPDSRHPDVTDRRAAGRERV
jgi:poly(A) polymerase